LARSKPVKPLEIYLPIELTKPLKNILKLLYTQKLSQKDLVDQSNLSKGLISKYLKQLRELGLITISKKKKGNKRFFDITEKGFW